MTFWVQGMQLRVGGKGFIDIGYELDLEGGAEYEWRKRWDGVNHVEKKYRVNSRGLGQSLWTNLLQERCHHYQQIMSFKSVVLRVLKPFLLSFLFI